MSNSINLQELLQRVEQSILSTSLNIQEAQELREKMQERREQLLLAKEQTATLSSAYCHTYSPAQREFGANLSDCDE